MNIYINLNSKEINYLSKEEVKKDDVTLASLAGTITLVSVNDVKSFPSVDMELNDAGDLVQRNSLEIQNLIKNKYKVLNDDMVDIVGENYDFCPYCGESFTGNEKAMTVVIDAGFSLANIAKDNIYPFKEIECANCHKTVRYRYPIISNKNERKEFLKTQMNLGLPVYVKSNFVIDKQTGAYVPVYIYFKHLTSFFDVKPNEKGVSDLMDSLATKPQKEIVKILMDEEMQKYFLKNADEGLNIRFLPIRLGNYSNYSSQEAFDKIVKYSEIEDDQTRLFELVASSNV